MTFSEYLELTQEDKVAMNIYNSKVEPLHAVMVRLNPKHPPHHWSCDCWETVLMHYTKESVSSGSSMVQNGRQ